MCCCGVVVHCLSRLGAATAVLAAKLPCRDGVFATYTLECAKAVHHLNRVMSHRFSVVAHPPYDSKLKFISRPSSRLALYSFGISMTRSRSKCFKCSNVDSVHFLFYAFDAAPEFSADNSPEWRFRIGGSSHVGSLAVATTNTPSCVPAPPRPLSKVWKLHRRSCVRFASVGKVRSRSSRISSAAVFSAAFSNR